jgi:hypothetical protein
MRKPSGRRLALKLLTLGALSLGLVFLTRGRQATEARPPSVRVKPQAGAALVISSANVGASEEDGALVEIKVANVGDKPVRAFTVRQDEAGGSQSTRVTLVNMIADDELIHPGQTKDIVTDAGGTGLVLSLDFVEFTDGTTWGPDAYKTSEKLAGQRAGRGAAASHFSDQLKAGGPEKVIEAINLDSVPVPEGRSREWQDGFQTGVGIVKNRLSAAREQGGAGRIGPELQILHDEVERNP